MKTAPTGSTVRTASASPTVLFDANCGLCRRLVAAVSRLDRSGALVFVPLESEAGRLVRASAGREPVSEEGMVLVEGGRSFTKSEAAWRVLEHLGPPWGAAARALRLVPRNARDTLYDVVARRRYGLLGRPGAHGQLGRSGAHCLLGRAGSCSRPRGARP